MREIELVFFNFITMFIHKCFQYVCCIYKLDIVLNQSFKVQSTKSILTENFRRTLARRSLREIESVLFDFITMFRFENIDKRGGWSYWKESWIDWYLRLEWKYLNWEIYFPYIYYRYLLLLERIYSFETISFLHKPNMKQIRCFTIKIY